MIVGVDPGKLGALAFLEDDGAPIALFWTPLVHSTKGRDEYDERAMANLLNGYPGVNRPVALIAWEALQTLPPSRPGKVFGGGVANFQRGLAVGILRGLCAALELPSVAYRPQEWQREMLAGTSGEDTKARSLIAAGRLFPGVCFICAGVGGLHAEHGRLRKPRDGAADALLIAEFARRRRFPHHRPVVE